MKTTQKIAAARAIYHAVRLGRSLLGRTDRQIVVRNGVTYDLDLSQGIDFAIYLGIDPDVRAKRYAQREDDPGWRSFWERGEVYYFSDVRPPASFDLQLDAEALT